ncbi:hypothetical protein AJ79_09557 [Helicocarpus griseus UAMH5409]|uniref:R3H-associated N-terminal domain-containing protein n=1 Tax=Helicocarpus griseus UAMH5409 TaxID=1447875 RepID=A0A2B7WJ24_9EURO|nr:hypothetical protein AJ79_09557 [Helicocarpus griseus UAMH5409]
MAIHPTLHVDGSLTPQQAQEISVWSQRAARAIHGDNAPTSTEGATSTARVPGTSVSLAIPLDDEHHPPTSLPLRVRTAPNGETAAPVASATYRRREPLRRDSQKRREALLKGKEGSRRRQRWENDRLLNNPWAQPPSANDWQIQPTYQHRSVPYYLAPLWDTHFASKEHTKNSRKNNKDNDSGSQIPKELRLKLKHARAARGMLRDLEEEIRRFVEKYHEKQAVLRDEGLEDAPSPLSDDDDKNDRKNKPDEASDDSGSDDDEVVFVGRKGQMHDSPSRKDRLRKLDADMGITKEPEGEKMVFESLEEDRAAGFGRWLVHSLASYYGLRTWSVTVGNPARREAYVGINPLPTAKSRGSSTTPHGMSKVTAEHNVPRTKSGAILPQPLWATVAAC